MWYPGIEDDSLHSLIFRQLDKYKELKNRKSTSFASIQDIRQRRNLRLTIRSPSPQAIPGSMAGNGRRSSRFPSTPPPSIFLEPHAPLYTTTPEAPQRSTNNPTTAAASAGTRAPPLPPTTIRPHEAQRQGAAPSEPHILVDDFPEIYGAQEGWVPLASRLSARPSPTPATSRGSSRYTSASPSIRQVTTSLEGLTLPAYVSPNTQMQITSRQQVVQARQRESVRKPREKRNSDKPSDTRQPVSSKPEASAISSAYIGRPSSLNPAASTTYRGHTGLQYSRPHQTATHLAPPNPASGRVRQFFREDSRAEQPTSRRSRPDVDYRHLYDAAAPPHLQPPPASYHTAAPRVPRASGISSRQPLILVGPETVQADRDAYAIRSLLQGPEAVAERDQRAAELTQAVARSGVAAPPPVIGPVAHRSDEELDSDERDRVVRGRLRDRHDAHRRPQLAEEQGRQNDDNERETMRSYKELRPKDPPHTGETYSRAPLPERRGPMARRRRHSPREYSPPVSDGETDNDERNRRPKRQQEYDDGTRSRRTRDETERQSKSKRGRSKK